MLLVGSVALIHYIPNIGRQPADLDVILKPEDLQHNILALRPEKVTVVDESHLVLTGCNPPNLRVLGEIPRIVEIELAWPGSAAASIYDCEMKEHEAKTICSLYGLYWLKMSHRFRRNSPHFEKTRRDILLMRANGGFDREHQPARPEDYFFPRPSWFRQRERETYDYKHPRLAPGQNKSNFFGVAEEDGGVGMGGGVRYFFNHDWIHEVVARMYGAERPAYLEYKRDGEDVACDVGKFRALPMETRLRGVMEEATVLALERSQIPAVRDEQWVREGRKPEASWSYQYALEKVCTSITSGWFREFAWENYDRALAEHVKDYAERFWREAAKLGY